MKKILTILLSLCLLAALAVSLAVTSSADEDVSIGQRYEWNAQDADTTTLKNWRLGGGISPDGLWTYKIFVLNTEKYMPAVVVSLESYYAWSPSPGTTGLGYARVRDYGLNFHPAEAADIVKMFTCPSGGTVTLETNIARVFDFDPSSGGTPTSFAVYVADGIGAGKKAENRQKVYPLDNDFESITSSKEKTISVDIDVKKGQVIFVHIGAIDGQQGSDSVNMTNSVTYIAVNDEIAEEVTDVDTGRTNIPTRTDSVGPLTGADTGNGSVSINNADEGGSSMGLIIGIVVGVAVVAAVAVVILLKKKKSE